MSEIENDRLSRASRLQPATLNEKFSDITAATTAAIDGTNVAREGIDLPNLDTNATNGQSDIILRSMLSANLGSSGPGAVTISFSTSSSPPAAPTYIGNEISYTSGISLVAGDIIRVYWSMNVEQVYTTNVALIRELWWALWLQWDITSAARANYTEVPGQGNFNDDITGAGKDSGSDVTSMYGCSLVAQYIRVIDVGGATTLRYAQAPTGLRAQAVNGSWYYRVTTNTTLYGLRMVGGGLLYPFCDTTGALGTANVNYLRYANNTTPGVNAPQQLIVHEGKMSAIIMRDN